MDLTPYLALCRAMVALLNPLIEIVIHDVKSNTIAFIAGSLSGRKVGDPSLLAEFEALDEMVYGKLNFDGRLVRSISVPLREKGDIKALLCLNCDVSIFAHMHALSAPFLATSLQDHSEALFKNDWQHRLHLAIHQLLDKNGWTLGQLTREQKKAIVHALYASEAFAEKHAADYIAKILSMGRATIFKYLKAWRTKYVTDV